MVTSIPTKPRGRPPLLRELYSKLIHLLKAICGKVGDINIHVVSRITQGLVESNHDMTHLSNFNMPCTWVHTIYHRMGFTRRAWTTSQPPVPYDLYHESRQITYLRGIAEKIKAYSIPPDKTPNAFVPVGNMTMAEKGDSKAHIKGKSPWQVFTHADYLCRQSR